jgi:hypothetical protein
MPLLAYADWLKELSSVPKVSSAVTMPGESFVARTFGNRCRRGLAELSGNTPQFENNSAPQRLG